MKQQIQCGECGIRYDLKQDSNTDNWVEVIKGVTKSYYVCSTCSAKYLNTSEDTI